MIGWLKSMLSGPKPSGPPEVIRKFQNSDRVLSQEVAAVDDGWVVDAREAQTFRLFEVQDPQVDQCLLAYRVKLKTEGLSGRAYLEMWCRLPGQGEFFSKGLNQVAKGTSDWASYEIPFYLKKGQRPDLIKLNLVVEGKGKVWLRELQLLKTPLSS